MFDIKKLFNIKNERLVIGKMTKEEAIQIILNNQHKSLNEIKRILKGKMSKEERAKFTSQHLFLLISEANQKGEEEKKTLKTGKTKNTRKIEGEER